MYIGIRIASAEDSLSEFEQALQIKGKKWSDISTISLNGEKITKEDLKEYLSEIPFNPFDLEHSLNSIYIYFENGDTFFRIRECHQYFWCEKQFNEPIKEIEYESNYIKFKIFPNFLQKRGEPKLVKVHVDDIEYLKNYEDTFKIDKKAIRKYIKDKRCMLIDFKNLNKLLIKKPDSFFNQEVDLNFDKNKTEITTKSIGWATYDLSNPISYRMRVTRKIDEALSEEVEQTNYHDTSVKVIRHRIERIYLETIPLVDINDKRIKFYETLEDLLYDLGFINGDTPKEKIEELNIQEVHSIFVTIKTKDEKVVN